MYYLIINGFVLLCFVLLHVFLRKALHDEFFFNDYCAIQVLCIMIVALVDRSVPEQCRPNR